MALDPRDQVRLQRHQINGREVVDTIEDTTKYQTGVGRRLRVAAQPLAINEVAEPAAIRGLATALGKVEPSLMKWAIDNQAEEYSRAIEIGKQKAQTGGVTDDEMEQYGYDKVRAINDWTDFNTKITTDYDQNFDKDSGDIEEFLKSHWGGIAPENKSNDYMANFNPLVGKTLQKIREGHGIYQAKRVEQLNNAELTRMFASDIEDVMGSGVEYDVTQYEARREGLRIQFPGKTNSELDVLAYEAVISKMVETGDTDLVDVFKKPHADRTPGLYEIPAWKAKIDAAVRSVEAANVSADTKRVAANEKALKSAARQIESDVLFTLIDISKIEDAAERESELETTIEYVYDMTKKGIPISNTVIKTLSSASNREDKAVETKEQETAYVQLAISGASVSQAAAAFNRGDITRGSFDKLVTKARAAAKSGGGEKSLTSNPFFKDMRKAFQNEAGYSFASMDSNSQQKKDNSNAMTERMMQYAEEMIDSGKNPKEAFQTATERGLKMMREGGMSSSNLAAARTKIDAQEYKQKEPVKYYKANPADFISDSVNGTLPSMTPAEKKKLQVEARKAAKANQKLKKHESTK